MRLVGYLNKKLYSDVRTDLEWSYVIGHELKVLGTSSPLKMTT